MPERQDERSPGAKIWCIHSEWDLVGYGGGSPGFENAVKRWGRPFGPICFSVYFDVSRSFSPMREFTGSSIEAKCEPLKKFKQAHEKRMSEPVKSLYGVGVIATRRYVQLDLIYYGFRLSLWAF